MSKFALIVFVVLSSFAANAQQAPSMNCVDSKGGTYLAEPTLQRLSCRNGACSIADGTSLMDLQLRGKLSQVTSESANELALQLGVLLTNHTTEEALLYLDEMVSLLCSPPTAEIKFQTL